MQTKKQLISNYILNITKYALLFFLLIALELGMLMLSACIPTNKLQENMVHSANYLCENPVFFNLQESDKSSRIDRYADSILLNILYCYDSDNPLHSVMDSGYYYTATANENVNLQVAVTENKEPTVSYMRYWHGSISLLRPLLTVFHLEQIYIINSIFLTLLLIVLLVLLGKRFGKGIMISFLTASCINSIWYIPFSLEYTFMFMLMLIGCILIIYLYEKHPKLVLPFFFVLGSLSAYFDFLSTETITALMPLIIVLLLKENRQELYSIKAGMFYCMKAGLLWLLAYAFTWISKWLLATIILHENGFANALSQAAYRIQGNEENISGFTQIVGALLRNLSCLFPFSFVEKQGYVVVLGILLLLLIIYYLIKKREPSTPLILLLLLIGSIPYLRFALLANHSYIHYFFTYRAQLTTVFCICLIFVLNTDVAFLQKEWKKLWRKTSKKRK